MRSLFDDLGSASHNLTQKIKAKVEKSGSFEINGFNLVLGDTISEGRIDSRGGYGFIIKCTEVGTGKKYVLKKSICPVEPANRRPRNENSWPRQSVSSW